MDSSASSFFSVPQWKYDVLLSFRGTDTLDNFTSHLYAALSKKKINIFIEDGLANEEQISSRAILTKIEESKSSVVIFSKDSATSPLFLDVLVKVLECKKTQNQMFLPIFYQVNPSDAQEQTGSFGDAFAKHEQHLKGSMERVQRWRTALTEAANLSGYHFLATWPDSKLIDEIVGDILMKLSQVSSSPTVGLVGIDSRIERVESMLCIGSLDIHIVGIWGMGGIGKTTIAEAVFNRNSNKFEGCHFLANIREESNKRGLARLREELLSKLCRTGNFSRGTPNFGLTFAKSRLHRRKVLIVLDDVDHSIQLQELLVGERHLFGRGSKIIVTSRDRQVLKNEVDEIYEVEELNDHEALLLFSLNAFKQMHPIKEFVQLSKSVIYYAKGNPLALKVLGCFLFNKSKQDWENALNKLKRTPNTEIKNVLKLSYEGLDIEDKDIFLDIACFFKGEDVNFVTRILDGCDFSAPVDIGINNLIDKSLITISNKKLAMHDLLQEMGWEIVQQESMEEPGERSRLWNHEEIYHVLTENTGTQAVEGIILDLSAIRELHLTRKAFKKMYNLRLLKFYDSDSEATGKVSFPDEGLQFHSDKLRYFHWYRYPSRSLPSNFCPENLVELNLPSSNVEQLWAGVQHLVKLKRLDLSYSECLTTLPNLSKAQNLENLNLKGCKDLVDVPSSIQYLNKLECLNLEGCKNLSSLPSGIGSKFLRTINLFGCSKVKKCPEIAGNVEELCLNRTAIEEIPSSIETLTKLVSLDFAYCTRLMSFRINLCKLKYLQRLNLSGCSKIESFPEILETMECLKYLYFVNCKNLTSLPNSIGKLKSLTELDLRGTMITKLPSSIEHLSDLDQLELGMCKNLVSLPSSICKLKSLKLLNVSRCSKLDKLPDNLGNLESLEELDISGSAIKELPHSITSLNNLIRFFGRDRESAGLLQIPFDLGRLSSLKMLVLSGSNLESIPSSIGQLLQLELLDIGYCKRLHSLPELPASLQKLYAHECTSLEIILSSKNFCELDYAHESCNLKDFAFTNCFSLDQKTCSNLVTDAERRIQLMATASEHFYYDGQGSVKIYFPGCEVPKWFCNKNVGSLISLHLPSKCSQFWAIALCVVIEFEDCYVDRGLVVRCKCHFRSSHAECNDLIFNLDYWLDWYYKPILFKSNHVFLWDDHCLDVKGINEEDWFSKHNELLLEFYTLDYEENILHNCKVKRCGVHLLYRVAIPNRTFEFEEQEEEPDPKRLKWLQDEPHESNFFTH